MSELSRVLRDAEQAGVTLWVENNALRFRSPKGSMTEQLRTSIAHHKQEIIESLSSGDSPSDWYPTSIAQERLLVFERIHGLTAMNNIASSFDIRGALDKQVLTDAILRVSQCQDSLRTVFNYEHGRFKQRVVEQNTLEITDFFCTSNHEREAEAEVNKALSDLGERCIDPLNDRLFHLTLIHVQPKRYRLVAVFHHVSIDAAGIAAFWRDVWNSYQARSVGEKCALVPPTLTYRDYSAQQRRWLHSDELEVHRTYWGQKLNGVKPLLEVSTDRPRPSVQTYRGNTLRFAISTGLASGLETLCASQNVTLHTVMTASLALLLSVYSGQDDVVVGCPLHGERQSELEGVIGLFVKALPIRVTLSNTDTVTALLGAVQASVLEGFEHQDLPFEAILDAADVERDSSFYPLFQHMLTVNRTESSQPVAGLELEEIPVVSRYSKLDTTFSFSVSDDRLEGAIEYNCDLFDETTIRQMWNHYVCIAERLTATPTMTLCEAKQLPHEQLARVQHEWKQSIASNTGLTGWLDSFRLSVDRYADSIAVSDDLSQLTYRQLDQLTDTLAQALRAKGAGAEVTIALCMERSVDMVVVMVAILKSGAAFIPLTKAMPAARIESIVNDANVLLLVADTNHLYEGTGAETCSIGELMALKVSQHTDPVNISPDNLAYVIYTSGTSGAPKGVQMTHRGLAYIATALAKRFRLDSNSRLMQFVSLSFDVSVADISATLACGATLHIYNDRGNNLRSHLPEQQVHHHISHLQLPASVLASLPDGSFQSLSSLVSGGEHCSVETAHSYRSVTRDFFNAYGPTEAAVCASMGAFSGAERVVSTGTQLDGAAVYVLDTSKSVCPANVIGEVHIGGSGLARGYLGAPGLTATRFVPDPYAPTPGERMYQTGDFGKRNAEGCLELAGRSDRQIKLRGFRIELEEIESALLAITGITGAAVVVQEHNSQSRSLSAFVCSLDPHQKAADIEQLVRRKLPDYMVPQSIVVVDDLPLTRHGKVDYKQLQERASTITKSTSGRPAIGPLETTIADIWQQVLGRSSVGRSDNFFEIGGQSLLLTEVHEKLTHEANLELRIVDLFTYPTIESLAGFLQASSSSDRSRVVGTRQEDAGARRRNSLRHRRTRFQSRKNNVK